MIYRKRPSGSRASSMTGSQKGHFMRRIRILLLFVIIAAIAGCGSKAQSKEKNGIIDEIISKTPAERQTEVIELLEAGRTYLKEDEHSNEQHQARKKIEEILTGAEPGTLYEYMDDLEKIGLSKEEIKRFMVLKE